MGMYCSHCIAVPVMLCEQMQCCDHRNVQCIAGMAHLHFVTVCCMSTHCRQIVAWDKDPKDAVHAVRKPDQMPSMHGDAWFGMQLLEYLKL